MNKQALFLLTAVILFVSSCNDNSTGINPQKKPKTFPVYVINEGNFMQSNGSIFGFSPTIMEADSVYKIASGHKFYGFIQSANIIDDSLYIVSNSPNKIEVVSLNPLKSVGTINYSKTPTYIVPAGSGKAYVTNLNDKSVSVVNLKTRKETDKTISVGTNPYFGIHANDKVFVSNNGFGNDNTVSVIDTQTGSVVKTLTVGAGPKQMVQGPDGRLWVLCQGKIAYDSNYNRVPENDIPGSIYIIDPASLTVTGSIKIGGQPVQMTIDVKDHRAFVIFAGGSVEAIDTNTLQVTDSTFIDRTFSAIGYSKETHLLFLAHSNGYVQPGKVLLYNLQGTPVDSFATGYSPVGFQFVGVK